MLRPWPPCLICFIFLAMAMDVISQMSQFPNPSEESAFKALQAWKSLITRDPFNITSDWIGNDVCSYNGVFCSYKNNSSLPCDRIVTGIDLNHAYLSGTIPEEIGLMTDLVLIHLNSNFFRSPLPASLRNLTNLFELDLSNNRFSGKFPTVVLDLPALHYLDIRYNLYRGEVPPELFDKKLDAIFMNHNNFDCELPANFGNSPASVIVLAGNYFQGSIPGSVKNMTNLNEVILQGNKFSGCVPGSLGELLNLTVFDVQNSGLGGELPTSLASMTNIEQLNVADNLFSGAIPQSICNLPKLKNFTVRDNFFTSIGNSCRMLESFDDKQNCIPHESHQRPEEQCRDFLALPLT